MAPTSSSPLLTAQVAESKAAPDHLPAAITSAFQSSSIPKLPSFMANLSPITPENPLSSGDSTSVFPVTLAVEKLEPAAIEPSVAGESGAVDDEGKSISQTKTKPDSEVIGSAPCPDEEDDVYVSLSGDISGGSLDVDRGSSCNPSLVSEEPSLGDLSLLGRPAEPWDKVDLEKEHEIGSAGSDLAPTGSSEAASEGKDQEERCAEKQGQVVSEDITPARVGDDLEQKPTGEGAYVDKGATDSSRNKEADVIVPATEEEAEDCVGVGGRELEQEVHDMEIVGSAESCDEDPVAKDRGGGAEDYSSEPAEKVKTGEEVMDVE